jgi:hypothetical protein
MTRAPASLPLLLAAFASLAACAADGPYPSLAERPAEREFAEEAARGPAAPATLPDDPALAERVAALTAEARRGEAEFEAAYAAAAAAAARAGVPGSDGWVEAQQGLSRASAEQARTTRALAELDQFALARTQTGTLSAADGERLRAATAAIQALANSQADRVKRLEESLRRG